jgi:hypothetical protein
MKTTYIFILCGINTHGEGESFPFKNGAHYLEAKANICVLGLSKYSEIQSGR